MPKYLNLIMEYKAGGYFGGGGGGGVAGWSLYIKGYGTNNVRNKTDFLKSFYYFKKVIITLLTMS